jgi:alanine racemase
MSLHAQVAEVREVPAGAAVGYGGAWTASRPSLLAVLPVGYGDGYPWRLGNRAEVLLNGRRAPIRGRICMDQLLVDVTDVPRIAAGRSVATLLGAQGEEEIRVGELAERADTIPYEIFTRMGERLPRICRRAEDEAAAPLPVGGGRESGRIE